MTSELDADEAGASLNSRAPQRRYRTLRVEQDQRNDLGLTTAPAVAYDAECQLAIICRRRQPRASERASFTVPFVAAREAGLFACIV